jgi:hypothetical protein
MRETTRKALSGLMVLAAAGGITAGIADAAKSKKDNHKSKKAAKKSHRADRHARGGPDGHWRPAPPPELTGDAADKAKAAALEAVPGGTVRHAFKAPDPARDPNVAYVVFVEKAPADGEPYGAPVLVLLDKNFKLVKTLDRMPHGGPGDSHRGPHGGPPNEPELTGDDADKAKAAALEAVPGGTAWRASREDPAEDTGAAYEVHVRKADGSEVEVLLGEDFKVIKTVAWDHPQGPPPGAPGGPPPGAGYPGPPGDGPAPA